MVQWRAISFNIPTLDLDACRSMSGEIHHCWHMKSIIVGLLVTERGSILTQILRPSVWMVLQSMAFVFDEIGGTAVLLYSYIRNALITNSEFVRIGGLTGRESALSFEESAFSLEESSFSLEESSFSLEESSFFIYK